MASTYTANVAINMAKEFVANPVLTNVDSQIADSVNSIMWLAHPWEWAQSQLTAIAMVDGTQDYTIADTDVHKLLRVRLVQTSATPDKYHELNISDYLAPDLSEASYLAITSAYYAPAADRLRLNRAIAISSGETVQAQGEYWADPTKIGDSQLTDPLPFPDQYFDVFQSGVLWKLMTYVNDSRANDWRTIFYQSLDDMRMAEDHGGNSTEFPDEPFGVRADSGFGIYGQ